MNVRKWLSGIPNVRNPRNCRSAVLILLSLAVTCGGCGVGEYEKRMDQRAVELRRGADSQDDDNNSSN